MKPYFETKLGKLYNGDCRDILPAVVPDGSVDLCFMDPPYPSDVGSLDFGYFGRCRAQSGEAAALKEIGSGKKFNTSEYLELIEPKLRSMVMYCYTSVKGIYDLLSFAKRGEYFYNVLAWIKTDAPFQVASNFCPDLEYLIYLHNGKPTWNVGLESNWYRKYYATRTMKRKNKGDHPCEKPARGVYPYIMLSSNPGDLVLDPFCGSGTTPAAAEMAGRKWIAIEKLEKYCEASAQRIENTTAMPLYTQAALFEATDPTGATEAAG